MDEAEGGTCGFNRLEFKLYRHSYAFCNKLHASREQFSQGSKECGLKTLDIEWDNIRKGQIWAASRHQSNDKAACLTSDYADGIGFAIGLRLSPLDHLEWLKAGLSAARILGDPESEGPHLGNMAKCLFLLGDYVEALRKHQEHVAVSRKTGDVRNELKAIGGCGASLLELGDYYGAFKYCEQSLEMCRELDARSSAVSALTNLANVFHRSGDFASAVFYHQRSANLARYCGDLLGEGISLVNIADSNIELGRSHRALDFANEALVLFREQLGAAYYEGRTLGVMGEANKQLGELDQAIALAQKAIEVLEKCGDESGVKAVQARIAYWRGDGEHPDTAAREATASIDPAFSINDQLNDWLTSLGIDETIEDHRSDRP